MKDEVFEFISDIKEKKQAATGYRHKVRNTGCKLPFEFMKKKELNALNGECITRDLSKPIPWKEFIKLPKDVQQEQLEAWANCYGGGWRIVAILANTNLTNVHNYVYNHKISGCSEKEFGEKNIEKAQFVADVFYGRTGEVTEDEEAKNIVIAPVVEKEEYLPAKRKTDFDFDFSVTKNGNEKQISDVLFGIVQMLNNIEGNFEMAISLRANNG